MTAAPATSIEESLDDTGYDPGRSYSLRVRETDVRSVLLAIARESDLSIVIEPDVSGAVTQDIVGVTLPVLLDSLLTPIGLEYRVENRVLKIRLRRMETRFFFLDIVQTDRNGSRTIGVSTGSQGGWGGLDGGNGGGPAVGAGAGDGGRNAGGNGGGSASVQSSDPSFIWDDITEGALFLMGSGYGGSFGGGGYDPLNPNSQRLRGGLGGFGGGGGFAASDGSALQVNRSAGTVMVRHYPDVLDEIGAYLASVEEIAQRQVMIEAKIVEVLMHNEFAAGVDWSAVFSDLGMTAAQTVGASGLNIFQAGIQRQNFNAVLGAMSNQGDVDVLSSPSVVTMNNQVALLSVGTQEVFFNTQTIFNNQGGLAQTVTNAGTVTNGVILSVTPQISADGWVTMSIQPAISSLAGEAISPNGDRFPVMDVRVTDNVIRVREGETIFIGGLLEDVSRESVSKTPILGDIPILGSLFKRKDRSTRKSDLVVMITPTVLNGDRVRELMRDQLQRLEMRRRSRPGARRVQ
jgi:MSHA biogenesis protein MshL